MLFDAVNSEVIAYSCIQLTHTHSLPVCIAASASAAAIYVAVTSC